MNQTIEDMTPSEYFHAFINLMESRQRKQGTQTPVPFRQMIDDLLMVGYLFERLIDEVAAEHPISAEARARLHAALNWRKNQLLARAAVCNNQN